MRLTELLHCVPVCLPAGREINLRLRLSLLIRNFASDWPQEDRSVEAAMIVEVPGKTETQRAFTHGYPGKMVFTTGIHFGNCRLCRRPGEHLALSLPRRHQRRGGFPHSLSGRHPHVHLTHFNA